MPTIGISEILLRVSAAFLAGFLVGWERERHGRPAGLRTNILACIAAAISMIIAENLLAGANVSSSGSVRADPARLGAGVLAGIGFLGAGTILRHENFIRGVTTAATLWTVTMLGLAFGAGMFVLGGIGVAFTVSTLLMLSAIEKRLRSDWYATLTIVTSVDSLSEIDWKHKVEDLGAKVQTLKVQYELETGRKTLTCDVKLQRSERFELCSKLVQSLRTVPGVARIGWS